MLCTCRGRTYRHQSTGTAQLILVVVTKELTNLHVLNVTCRQVKKRYRKVTEFWTEVGVVVSHSATETERLLKNLHSEYQRIRMSQHMSGIETVGQPVLRGSEELYVAYDNFYALFYPQGGSAVPAVVMTESSMQSLMR